MFTISTSSEIIDTVSRVEVLLESKSFSNSKSFSGLLKLSEAGTHLEKKQKLSDPRQKSCLNSHFLQLQFEAFLIYCRPYICFTMPL